MLCMNADTSSSFCQTLTACFVKPSCQHTTSASHIICAEAHCCKTAEPTRLDNIWRSLFKVGSYAAVMSLLSALTVLFV